MSLRWVDEPLDVDKWPGVEEAPKLFQFLVDERGEYVAAVVRWHDDSPTYANVGCRERSGAMRSDEAAREWCLRKLRPN